MGMTKLEAKFTTVTPLFVGGADHQTAELRVPSIKGVIRFWWRALALGRYYETVDAVENVRKVEASLFGSADTGKSAVMIKQIQKLMSVWVM